MKRKIKNKIRKIISVYDELFEGPLNVKDNVVTSEFFYLYVDEDAVTYISPCLNENYSTFLCLFLLRLTEKKISPVKILEGYIIDNKNNKLIPEGQLQESNEDTSAYSEMSDKISLNSDIEIVGGLSRDVIIKYKDGLLSKPKKEKSDV